MSTAAAIRALNKSVDGVQKVARYVDREFLEAMSVPALKSANEIVVRAKKLCPVGRTGALKNSIRVLKKRGWPYVVAGSKKVDYARIIHFGWAAKGIPPRYFMYDAAEMEGEKKQAMERYAKEVEKLFAAGAKRYSYTRDARGRFTAATEGGGA